MGTDTGTGTVKKRKTGRPKGSKSGYTVTEKALSQRRKNAGEINRVYLPAETQEGIEYNAKQIEHILAIHEIAMHANPKDPVSLRSCFINYLQLCQRDGCKVGNLAAYASMGVTKNTVNAWEKSNDPVYVELARFVKSTCALCREGLISDQKINPVIGIFWQRNYDGLRNDTEQIQSASEASEHETMSTDDYKQRYGKLIDE